MRIAVIATILASVCGALLLVAGTTLALDVAGIALLALSGVAAAELAFFAVGRSEDRDRMRHSRPE